MWGRTSIFWVAASGVFSGGLTNCLSAASFCQPEENTPDVADSDQDSEIFFQPVNKPALAF
jgi:hypothetical protein